MLISYSHRHEHLFLIIAIYYTRWWNDTQYLMQDIVSFGYNLLVLIFFCGRNARLKISENLVGYEIFLYILLQLVCIEKTLN